MYNSMDKHNLVQDQHKFFGSSGELQCQMQIHFCVCVCVSKKRYIKKLTYLTVKFCPWMLTRTEWF